MKNFDEQTEELLNKEFNLIDICNKSLEIQKRKYEILKKNIIEWEGALIRANLPFKTIKYKGKNSPENMWKEWK